MITHAFPRFKQITSFYFKFSLAEHAVNICSDCLLLLLWQMFFNTQLKTALNYNFDELGSGNFFFETKINAGYILKNIYLILFQIPPENAEHK